MAVSDDLRERVVEAVVLGGLSRNQAAARFKVSVASSVRWVKRFTTTGDISPAPSGGDRRSGRIGSRRGGGWNWVGVVSGLFNPNDSGVGALERRPRHDEGYHEGGGCGRRSFAFG